MARLETITRRDVLLLGIGATGAEEARGTADAGGAATLDDSFLVHPNTDQLRGHNIYILDGTAQGDDRFISAFTPASDRITVTPNWSATVDSTSVYVILTRPWRIKWFIEGLNHAIREAQNQGVLIEKVITELRGQDILFGAGGFQRWPSGTSAAPQGWTLDGNSTIARRTESPILYHQYHPRITSDGSNLGRLNLSITNFSAFRDQVVELRGFIRTNTASRVTMDVTDGVTTNTSTAISASGDLNEWRDSEDGGPAVTDLTINANPTELTVNLRISAGGAVQADFAEVRLLNTSRAVFEFDIPQGDEETLFKYINAIEIGEAVRDNFHPMQRLESIFRRRQQFRIIDRETERRLWIELGGGGTVAPTFSSLRQHGPGTSVSSDHPIRIHGQAVPAVVTSDDTNMDMSATYLTNYVAWWASLSLPESQQERFGVRSKIPTWERNWNSQLAAMNRKPKAGSIKVYGA